CFIRSVNTPLSSIVPRYSSRIAYPTQFLRSPAPCVSHVFDDSVINTRTNFVLTLAASSRIVSVPPLPSFTAPAANVFHCPLSCSSIASPSPTQCCTAYTRAYGSAHAIRITLTLCIFSKLITTHCACTESSSPVNSLLKYGLLFQYVCSSPSSSRENPSNSDPLFRVNPRCGNEYPYECRIISVVGVASPTKYPCPAGSLHFPFGFQCQACTNKSVFCR